MTFTLEIRNQGTVAATNIELIDYIPVGFSLSPNNSANWTDGGSTATYASIASLALQWGDHRRCGAAGGFLGRHRRLHQRG
ncbi:MAG: hypothetical protein R2911_01750 [Caldilineaceae bacterium]